MNVKAIGFDLDDTLYYRGDYYKKIFEIMQKKVAKVDVNFDIFFGVLLKNSEIEYEKFMKNLKTKNAYKNDRVISTYKEFGVTLENEDAIIFNSLYLYFRENIKLRPYVKELLDYLSEQKIELFILTNGAISDQYKKIKLLGLEKWISKDRWFVSEELQMTKPNSEIFKFVEKKIGISGSDICYVGDSYINDIKGAKKLGWETVYFSNDSINKNYTMKINHFKDLRDKLIESNVNQK